MRKFFVALIAMFALAFAAVTFAAPIAKKQKADALQRQSIDAAAPTVASVPLMNGYDVIQNITSESRDLSIAQNQATVVTTARMRLSPEVDWCSPNQARLNHTRPRPRTVLRA